MLSATPPLRTCSDVQGHPPIIYFSLIFDELRMTWSHIGNMITTSLQDDIAGLEVYFYELRDYLFWNGATTVFGVGEKNFKCRCFHELRTDLLWTGDTLAVGLEDDISGPEEALTFDKGAVDNSRDEDSSLLVNSHRQALHSTTRRLRGRRKDDVGPPRLIGLNIKFFHFCSRRSIFLREGILQNIFRLLRH